MGKFLDKITFEGGLGVKDGDALGATTPTFTVQLTSAIQSTMNYTFSFGAVAGNPYLLDSAVAHLFKALIRKGVLDGTSTEG